MSLISQTATIGLSGFMLNQEFIPDHNDKIKSASNYTNKNKEGFLNFYIYLNDAQGEILSVGCNSGGITSFIQSQKILQADKVESYNKDFLENAVAHGMKQLPQTFLSNLNDMNLNMQFVSWNAVIDSQYGDIMIVGIVPATKGVVFWTQILISPLMLDYEKADLPIEQRFNLKDMKKLYECINP